MKPLALAVLAAAGFTIYWVVTASSAAAAGSTTTTINSPLNAIGGLAGQGTSGLDTPGIDTAPPIVVPPPITPNLSDLQRQALLNLQSSGGLSNPAATNPDPIGTLLNNTP